MGEHAAHTIRDFAQARGLTTTGAMPLFSVPGPGSRAVLALTYEGLGCFKAFLQFPANPALEAELEAVGVYLEDTNGYQAAVYPEDSDYHGGEQRAYFHPGAGTELFTILDGDKRRVSTQVRGRNLHDAIAQYSRQRDAIVGDDRACAIEILISGSSASVWREL